MKGSSHLEVLDQAVQRLKAGDELVAILAEHPLAASDLRPLLATARQLEALRAVDIPSREHQMSDRARFLNELRNLRAQAVSPNPLVRLKRWITRPFSTSPTREKPVGKEKRAMIALLLKVVLVLGLGLGSAGGTVALAEQSLPGSPLYPVKLAAEELQIRTTPNLANRALLYLTQAQVRVREMEALMQQRRSPDGVILEQLRVRMENALQLASGLPDPEMIGWLAQAREAVRTQQETLARLCQRQEAGATGSSVPCHALALANQAREQIEAGLQDPQAFRHRHSLQLGDERRAEPTPVATPPARPGPGQPGGNPECPECTPQGDQHRYGPQPTQPGPGRPGGNSECPECTPQGDQYQHRYGPGPTATRMWQRMTGEEALQLMHVYEHRYEYEHQYRLSATPTATEQPSEPCSNCQPGGNQESTGGTGGGGSVQQDTGQNQAGTGPGGGPSGSGSGGGSSGGGSGGNSGGGGSSGGGSGGNSGGGGSSGGGSGGSSGGGESSRGGGRHGK